MSDQEFYQIAHQRIDRRNRRWTLWSFDLAGLILSVAALVLLSSTPYVIIGAAIMIAWAGVFVLHTIVTSMAHSREDDIQKEVAKLRELSQEASYEKPKRLQLTEDGELADDTDWAYEEPEHRLKS